jgi:hypothetical protein
MPTTIIFGGGYGTVGEALKKNGITNSTIAGGHGTTAKQAEIGSALGTEVSSR